MSEKKIDLSDVKVGDPLWTIQNRDDSCTSINEHPFRIGTNGDAFTINGERWLGDKFPSCYHNYQEFLDFHAIAPVRMTEKELEEQYDEIDSMCAYAIAKRFYIMAGGQIIEKPVNLPCPVCGCEMKDIEPDKSVDRFLQHPDNGCLFSKQCHQASVWNDPSKRGGK
jgi:hypothetical protein